MHLYIDAEVVHSANIHLPPVVQLIDVEDQSHHCCVVCKLVSMTARVHDCAAMSQ